MSRHGLMKQVRSAALTIAAVTGLMFASLLQAAAQSAVEPETVTGGLSFPWSVAFLPEGGYLITERDGVLKVVSEDGAHSFVEGGPDVFAQGQGGLLDIVLSPDFEVDRTVFMSFSQGSPEGAGTSVYRAMLIRSAAGYGLEDGRTIFSGNNKGFGGRHFGSRLAFAPDGFLFMTLGDRGEDDRAQDPADHTGSVLRLTVGGDPAPGNPFLDDPAVQPEIWSIGHRNPQSAAIHPETGALWTVEHGAQGGDEVNVPEAGKNYGWPVISYGRHYSGAKIGEGTHKPGMEQPIHYWDPSIAPSGMAFVTSDKYPQWHGGVLVGALRGRYLAKLDLDGRSVVSEDQLLTGLGERIRDVRQAPDGWIYVLTDSDDGRLIRLVPKG